MGCRLRILRVYVVGVNNELLKKEEFEEFLSEKTAETIVERVSGRILETFNLVLTELRRNSSVSEGLMDALNRHTRVVESLNASVESLDKRVAESNRRREELTVKEEQVLDSLASELR